MLAASELLVLYALLSEIGCEEALAIVADALDQQPQSERPIIPAIWFRLLETTDANAELDFRFNVRGIRSLTTLFALPDYIITPTRDKLHSTEAMCALLHRLSYTRRHFGMAMKFGRSVPAVTGRSRVTQYRAQ